MAKQNVDEYHINDFAERLPSKSAVPIYEFYLVLVLRFQRVI